MHTLLVSVLFSLLTLALLPDIHAQTSVKNREKYPYMLYLPKQYNAAKANYPLVIYLHGGSQRGQDLSKLKEYGLPSLVDKGRDFPFIIVAPQCPEGKFWSTDNWFDLLYADLLMKYRVDQKRVYLTGISMGGYGAWQTAVAYPDKFAAVMPLCGGCDDSTQICRVKHIPIWTFHGAADDLVPISETERLVKRLNACQGQVKFTRLEKEGHQIQCLYEDNALYAWLLKKHK